MKSPEQQAIDDREDDREALEAVGAMLANAITEKKVEIVIHERPASPTPITMENHVHTEKAKGCRVTKRDASEKVLCFYDFEFRF